MFCLAAVAGVAVPTASSAAVAAACPSPLIAPGTLAIGPAASTAAATTSPVVAAVHTVPTAAAAVVTVAPTIAAAAAVVAPSIGAGVGGPVVVVAIAAPP